MNNGDRIEDRTIFFFYAKFAEYRLRAKIKNGAKFAPFCYFYARLYLLAAGVDAAAFSTGFGATFSADFSTFFTALSACFSAVPFTSILAAAFAAAGTLAAVAAVAATGTLADLVAALAAVVVIALAAVLAAAFALALAAGACSAFAKVAAIDNVVAMIVNAIFFMMKSYSYHLSECVFS